MNARGDTLAWMFGIRDPEQSDKRLDAAAMEAIGKAVVATAGAALGAGAPAAIAKTVACVAQALEKRLGDILVTGWNKRKEIAKYGDLEKYPPGQKRYVQLYEHPVTWTYRPYVEIVVRGATFKIDVVVTVKLTVDQAVLVIDGGRVMSIEPGKVTAEGSAKIGDFKLCNPIKKELGTLPGSIGFGEGIPLAANGSAGP
jgi:hypothetical protein